MELSEPLSKGTIKRLERGAYAIALDLASAGLIAAAFNRHLTLVCLAAGIVPASWTAILAP